MARLDTVTDSQTDRQTENKTIKEVNQLLPLRQEISFGVINTWSSGEIHENLTK